MLLLFRTYCTYVLTLAIDPARLLVALQQLSPCTAYKTTPTATCSPHDTHCKSARAQHFTVSARGRRPRDRMVAEAKAKAEVLLLAFLVLTSCHLVELQ
jgi:hypothetical protein